MKYLLILLLFFTLKTNASQETPHSSREAFSPTSHYLITPSVNVITGDCLEESCDLIVAGVEPLSVRRFYTQNTPYHPVYTWWRFNPEHCCTANFEWDKEKKFAAVSEPNGSVACYEKQNGNGYSFLPSGQTSFAQFHPSGKTHPLNTKVIYQKIDVDYEGLFRWTGEIIDGSGCKKYFLTNKHSWLCDLKLYEYPRHREGEYYITPASWTPYHLPIYEERKPNGNILCYTYRNVYDKEDYPSYYLLTSITAYNSSKTKKLGSLEYNYITAGKSRFISTIEVKGSDQRKAIYHINAMGACVDGAHLSKLQKVISPNNPTIAYEHIDAFDPGKARRICKTVNPQGRELFTEYEPNGLTKARYAPVGPSGERVTIAQYIYHTGVTDVQEPENIQTRYHYDTNKRMTGIETFDGNDRIRVIRNTWDRENGNLLYKEIHDGDATLYFKLAYRYDERQNPIEELICDDLESNKLTRTFSADGYNNKLSERDESGKTVIWNYIPNSDLIASEFICEADQIKRRTFYTYDDCAICIKKIIDDGITSNPGDLTSVSYRLITETTPRYEHPCFGLPEIVEEKTIDASGQEVLLHKTLYEYAPSGKVQAEHHYDRTGAHYGTLTHEYDSHERLITQTNAVGHQIHYTYDENNNCLTKSGPRPCQQIEWTYDKADRPILENNAGQITHLSYDALGRLISKIDPAGCKTGFKYDALNRLTQITYPDGSIEKKVYDPLGRVIKEIDPKGYEKTFTYNFRGQPTQITHPDGTIERFKYAQNGTLQEHVHKNGSKTLYTHDIFERPLTQKTYTASGELLKTHTTTYNAFTKQSETDAQGITTYYTYDFSGKKTSEKRGDREILYFYDEMNRLTCTQIGDTKYHDIYDIQNNLIEKRTEDLNGHIYFQENYRYDASNNRTHIITCEGVKETVYDAHNHPSLEISPEGAQTHISYTYQDQICVKTTKDPLDVQKEEYYDGKARLCMIQIKNQEGAVIQKRAFQFDLAGNQIEATEYIFEASEPIKTITNTWRYGPNNRLEELIEAGTKKTCYTYDDCGRLATIIKPDSTTLTHHYDALGRLAELISSRKDIHHTYIYDINDRLIEVKDHSETTKRNYDIYGNLTSESLATGLTLQSTYDTYGRRTKIVYPNKYDATFSYKGPYLHQISFQGSTHTYQNRNHAGKVTKALLPTGAIEIEYDSSLRWKSMKAPSFSATYAYDARGSLINYKYKDALGTKEETYRYDPLNQLIYENEHEYCYDSHYNRVMKDGLKHTLNDLFQLTSDGKTEYVYDLNGNLIQSGDTTFEYDSLDRLITVKKQSKTTHYKYDPFNRRISKITPHLTTNYYWDEKNEVGSTKGGQIRVLGEGFGAEIGAAVFYKLYQSIFVPIHDHRGAVIALLDRYLALARETIRYTAYGEETTTQERVSPWRFASKRYDEETGYLYFGRRYYSPNTGRWVTSDPNGFQDGPNLYAYALNSPMCYCDLHGLWSNPFEDTRSAGDLLIRVTHLAFYAIELIGQHLIPVPGVRDVIESIGRFGRGGKLFDTCEYKKSKPAIYKFEGTHVENVEVTCTNGILTTYERAIKQTADVSRTHGDVAVTLFYNPTQGLMADLLICIGLKLGIITPFEKMQADYMNTELAKNTKLIFWSHAHSQGGTRAMNISKMLIPGNEKRISLFSYGSATLIPNKTFDSTENNISKFDLIYLTNPIAAAAAWFGFGINANFLPPHSYNPLSEHYISGKTYYEAMQRIGNRFQDLYLRNK